MDVPSFPGFCEPSPQHPRHPPALCGDQSSLHTSRPEEAPDPNPGVKAWRAGSGSKSAATSTALEPATDVTSPAHTLCQFSPDPPAAKTRSLRETSSSGERTLHMVEPGGLLSKEALRATGLQARLVSLGKRTMAAGPSTFQPCDYGYPTTWKALYPETAQRAPHVAYRQHFRCAPAAHLALLSVHSAGTCVPEQHMHIPLPRRCSCLRSGPGPRCSWGVPGLASSQCLAWPT